MTIPLVLIILGYGIHFQRAGLGDVVKVAALRACIMVPLALALNHFVLRRWLGLPPGFEAGLFTLFIMPPPFGIPLFTRDDHPEMAYVNNTLTLYTFFSIAAFTVYLAFVPAI